MKLQHIDFKQKINTLCWGEIIKSNMGKVYKDNAYVPAIR